MGNQESDQSTVPNLSQIHCMPHAENQVISRGRPLTEHPMLPKELVRIIFDFLRGEDVIIIQRGDTVLKEYTDGISIDVTSDNAFIPKVLAANAVGIKTAICPHDPPYDFFGPRSMARLRISDKELRDKVTIMDGELLQLIPGSLTPKETMGCNTKTATFKKTSRNAPPYVIQFEGTMKVCTSIFARTPGYQYELKREIKLERLKHERDQNPERPQGNHTLLVSAQDMSIEEEVELKYKGEIKISDDLLGKVKYDASEESWTKKCKSEFELFVVGFPKYNDPNHATATLNFDCYVTVHKNAIQPRFRPKEPEEEDDKKVDYETHCDESQQTGDTSESDMSCSWTKWCCGCFNP